MECVTQVHLDHRWAGDGHLPGHSLLLRVLSGQSDKNIYFICATDPDPSGSQLIICSGSETRILIRPLVVYKRIGQNINIKHDLANLIK